ncbi:MULTISPECIES: DUF2927 domain-containing protein [Pontibacillus]|uniref:DUF2927 domain-containing protein n=1 Tax=Pontibacillus chungwhensis TaxID=265426 RepID=A0ABY8V1Z9_9BACI|nr:MULTISPECIES: DUF2927 domain-containing protein [Pontibacillus]MCD5325510.1 DUF2927 domain-containing protein [Pontibacillus sp. HN14]WIF98620.1 DUF2927 domain-containing protein [Pontibacillus chungwhensis]
MAKRWILLVVMVIGFVHIKPALVHADDPLLVSPRKEWRIVFNTPLDSGTVSEDSVYITRSSDGERMKVQVSLSDNKRKVFVTPLVPYKSDETYTLHVSSSITSLQGVAMKAPQTLDFQAKEGMKYTDQSIEYFQEIAFGAEFNSDALPIRKWEINPRIQVHGSPTDEDMNAVKSTIEDVNTLQSAIDVKLVDKDANINIYYVPIEEFGNYVDNPREGNWGLFYYSWEAGYKITNATILISTDKPSQEGKSHLVREEITQSLGLPRDSYSYPDSIFFQDYTTTQGFTDLDATLIQMLYEDEVEPGMAPDEAIDILISLKP